MRDELHLVAGVAELAGHVSAPDALALFTDRGNRGLFVAAVGPAESSVIINLTAGREGYGIEAHSEMTDIVIDPVESRTSEEILFLFLPHQEAFEATA